MNILVITEYYPPYIKGGCEVACRDFVEALQRKGLSVTILTGKYGLDKEQVDGNVYRILKTASISPYTFFTSSRFNLNRVLLYQAFYYLNYSRTSALLKNNRFDIVYVWRLQNVTLAPFRTVTDVGLKTIFHIEDFWLLNTVQWLNKNFKLLRQLLLRIQTEKLTRSPMIFLSQSVKKTYQELFPECMDAPVIPNGIKIENKACHNKRPTSDAKRQLLFVGRICKEKGVETLISAFNELVNRYHQKNCILNLFGEGEEAYVNFLKGKILNYGINSEVVFHGMQSREDILSLYSQYDITIVPSVWEEPFGLVVIESMLCKTPVIGSKIGGIAEIIDDRVNGILIPPNDKDSLADAVQELLEDKKLCKTIVDNAYKKVCERYDIDKLAGKVLTVMENICGHKKL